MSDNMNNLYYTELNSMAADRLFENKLTTEEALEISKAAEEATPEEVIKMRESIAKADEIKEEAEDDEEYVEEIRNISLDSSYQDLMAASEVDGLPESTVSIFDVGEDFTPNPEDVDARMTENISQMFEMSDEEMIHFVSLIKRYRNKQVENVYAELPQSVKSSIASMAAEQGIPFTQYNKMAKVFLDEFVNEAELDQTFIDIEKSLNEALKIPTIADMYSEHVKMTMDVKIPEMIEKLKAEDPDNADKITTLESVRTQFYDAYSLKRLVSHYEENARTRKLIRRDYQDSIRFCDEFNLKNDHSKFKMPDCTSIGMGLIRVFINEIDTLPEDIEEINDVQKRIIDMKITMDDINKFVVLFCRHTMTYEPSDLIDSTYMYYALRNITSLNLTNETKTDFAVELISNIVDIIEMIRIKEAEFNASNQSNKKRKSGKNVR